MPCAVLDIGEAALVPLAPADILPITGDPDDDTVLATARPGRADYLVTGDHGLLALNAHERVRSAPHAA